MTRARARTLRRTLPNDSIGRGMLGGSSVASLAALGCLVAALILLARTVGAVFIDHRNRASVAVLLIAMFACFAAWAVLRGLADVATAHVSSRVRRITRERALHTLATRASIASPGTEASTLADGVEALDGYVRRFLPARTLAAVGPLVVAGVIAFLDPIALIVVMFTGPMLIVLLALIGRRTRVLTERHRADLSRLHARFLDLVQGLGTLAAFDRTADAAASLDDANRHHATGTLNVLRTAFQTSLVLEWAATASTALVAVLVGLRVVDGAMEFTTAFTVLVLTPECFLPLRRLAVEYHAGSEGQAALAELAPLLRDAQPDPQPRTITLPGPVAPIAFEHVRVRYPNATGDAITGVDLRIEPGEVVALTGASGSGKTTIARALLGLVTPTDGRITVADVELATWDPEVWHSQIAWVPQRPTIFPGSVADNVRLGAPHASDAAVAAALEAAGAAEFVAELPSGTATRIGDGARVLSAGQRQRLALARAFLRDAPLVILDECTAHLDPATEAEIVVTLRTLLAGRTALLISHRPTPLTLADRIIDLDAVPVLVTP